MFIDKPGSSILAIDPGETTGIAVWDGWTGKLYVDQIDVGRGRRAVERVQSGRVESYARQKLVRKVGKQNEFAVIQGLESGCVAVLCDLILALGPGAFVICEDFVLRADMPVRSGKRSGLSPVRIGVRLDERFGALGLDTGDAWRQWGVFMAHGEDKRGIKVKDVSGVSMPYPSRVHRAEQWRLGGRPDDDSGVVWAGGGSKLMFKMPGTRIWLPGGEKAVVQSMKDAGLWLGGCPHGMDALMHLLAFARRTSTEIRVAPERLWSGGTQVNVS